jgi:hypothetical protein
MVMVVLDLEVPQEEAEDNGSKRCLTSSDEKSSIPSRNFLTILDFYHTEI